MQARIPTSIIGAFAGLAGLLVAPALSAQTASQCLLPSPAKQTLSLQATPNVYGNGYGLVEIQVNTDADPTPCGGFPFTLFDEQTGLRFGSASDQSAYPVPVGPLLPQALETGQVLEACGTASSTLLRVCNADGTTEDLVFTGAGGSVTFLANGDFKFAPETGDAVSGSVKTRATVPEPGTLALLGCGLLAGALLRRRFT